MAVPMDGVTAAPRGAEAAPGELRAVIDLDSILAMPAMPEESPIGMPTQSLRRFDRAARRGWADALHRSAPWLARIVVFGGGAALLGFGVEEMWRVVDVGEVTLLKWILLALFLANFSWIALSFASAVVGFAWLVFFAPKRPAMPTALAAKTAVVMPIYNEAPSRIFGALQAMAEDVAATGLGEHFDYFFLSDTTDPDVWVAEERALVALRDRLRGKARVFYRHRPKNTNRKAGNIADFVTRWGGSYPHMLVLDADSLMTGAFAVVERWPTPWRRTPTRASSSRCRSSSTATPCSPGSSSSPRGCMGR